MQRVLNLAERNMALLLVRYKGRDKGLLIKAAVGPYNK
jgi:hypothetical protein